MGNENTPPWDSYSGLTNTGMGVDNSGTVSGRIESDSDGLDAGVESLDQSDGRQDLPEDDKVETVVPEVVQIIEPEDSEKNLYKPRKTEVVRAEMRRGNLLPMLAVSAAKGHTEQDFVREVESETISDCLKAEMAAPCPFFAVQGKVVSGATAIAKVLNQKALAGDMSAIREVLNRTEGKVPNRTITSNTSTSVRGTANELSALMDKIDKNKS